MCIEIQIEGGPRIETCGELWTLVGQDAVVYRHLSDFTANECLCHVDIVATAEKSGYRCRSGWDESAVDFIWVAVCNNT